MIWKISKNRVMQDAFKLILFLLICCTMVNLSCSSRRSEPVKQKRFTTTDKQVLNGEKVFMIHCQKCHPAGEAGLGPAISSNPAPQFIKRFQVRHGLGVMNGEISREDLRDNSDYLKA